MRDNPSVSTADFNILLVDDDDTAVLVFERALRQVLADGGPWSDQCTPRLHIARDGDEALVRMRQEPFLHLVVLDLNMPRVSGYEVLSSMQLDSVLRALPVIIQTTSATERDIRWCYENGANGYAAKAHSYAVFREHLRALLGFWCWVARPLAADGSLAAAVAQG